MHQNLTCLNPIFSLFTLASRYSLILRVLLDKSPRLAIGGFGVVAANLQSGCNALIVAVLLGNSDCARLLLEAGAEKDATVRDMYIRAVFNRICLSACVRACPYVHVHM